MKLENKSDDVIFCQSCLTPNEPFKAFCHSCGSPSGATASLDPIQSIETQGFLFRRALEGRPRPIVLAGIWLIFFPVLLGSLYAAIYLFLNRTGFADFFFFWAFVGLAFVALVVLFRITRNYLTRPRQTADTIHSGASGE